MRDVHHGSEPIPDVHHLLAKVAKEFTTRKQVVIYLALNSKALPRFPASFT